MATICKRCATRSFPRLVMAVIMALAAGLAHADAKDMLDDWAERFNFIVKVVPYTNGDKLYMARWSDDCRSFAGGASVEQVRRRLVEDFKLPITSRFRSGYVNNKWKENIRQVCFIREGDFYYVYWPATDSIQTMDFGGSGAPRIVDVELPSKKAFDELLAKIEKQYPELNPDHPRYNKVLTANVLARIQALKNEGYSPADALRTSVDELRSHKK